MTPIEVITVASISTIATLIFESIRRKITLYYKKE